MTSFVTLISGANRGIGLAIAQHLHDDPDYLLSLGVRDPEAFNVTEHFADPSRVAVYHYDAMKPDSGQTWINETLNKFGRIDALVNNAGILKTFGIENYDGQAFSDMLQVNVQAPALLTAQIWEHLKNSKGRLINIVSVAGKVTRPNGFGYQATKHAFLAFTNSVRQTGWPHGIRTTAICPGWINTDMAVTADNCNLKPEEMTQPADVAKLVKLALETPQNAALPELIVNAECGPYF